MLADTEEFQRAATLLASRVQWQQLADACFDALLMVTSKGRIVLVNEEAKKLFEYPSGMMLGKEVSEFMPVRFRANHSDFITGWFSTKERRFMGRRGVLSILTRTGDEIPVGIGLSALVADEGVFAIVTIRPDRARTTGPDFRAVDQDSSSGTAEHRESVGQA